MCTRRDIPKEKRLWNPTSKNEGWTTRALFTGRGCKRGILRTFRVAVAKELALLDHLGNLWRHHVFPRGVVILDSFQYVTREDVQYAFVNIVEQLAFKDPLTGLANRRSVEESIQWRISREQMFCVVVLDLNKFKQVNDTHGHLAGDSLLRQFGQELKSNIRPSDIVGRWGGDEFIMVLDCDLPGARAQIERMKKWVLGDYTLQVGTNSLKINLDASIGVAQWQPGETALQITERADASMYDVKELSRSR